ncbi:hypothetical protein AC579_4929 [Pseudocercospora musae]|uniref:RhoGAP-domain-containing protein n=1 Tax=Pseudocercospora musae TaxID=113226 RepID=A0A139I266_9PEZI|nr:hypothetical protein AC579_4929 [Pseudocercospora musae]
MTAAMESPGFESPMGEEDVVYPCKGCGEILEEGKAFELAGNRWHIDCFRCNTCGTLLDSDANLLLLGDGSLICNNCTYSCSACGNKIEDLAILTGDQAFCSGCFRCRNCKRKIENLRYARTSQGIFCMSCHESLMARRRKKARTPKQPPPGGTAGAEKALPSLPPSAAIQSAFTPEGETPPDTYSEGPTPQGHMSPNQRQTTSRNGTALNNFNRDASPLSDDLRRDGPTLPASTYGESRPSNLSSSTDDDDSGYLPMAFDPTPVTAPPVQQQQQAPIPRKQLSRATDPSPPAQKENQPPRDYFGVNGKSSAKLPSRDNSRQDARLGAETASSRSVSTEREPDQTRSSSQSKPSPHILYQEKGRSRKRETSGNNTPVSGSNTASPVAQEPRERTFKSTTHPLATDPSASNQNNQDAFKLQDVPDSRRANSRKNSKAGLNSPLVVSPVEKTNREDHSGKPISPVSVSSQNSGINPFDDPRRKEAPIPGVTPVQPIPPKHADRGLPLRGDSLAAAALKSKQSTPDPSTPTTTSTSTQLQSAHERNRSLSSVPPSFADAQSTLSRDNSLSKPERVSQAPPRTSFDAPPPRAASRPSAPSKSVANDDFIAPRHAPPPPPPAAERHRHNESISTLQSEDRPSMDGLHSPALRSAGLPKYSLDGGFSMEDEMGRILRGEHGQPDGRAPGSSSPSVLRRVSNAVKHGRSFSDRAVTQGGRSPRNGSMEVGTPTITSLNLNITSPTGIDGLDSLRSSLRRAQHHIAELEAEKLALQEKLDAPEIKSVNNELREKRSTMAFLDTQRDMVVRELEVMTDHLAKAKDNTQPLDLGALKTNILRDFATSLQQLKDSMGAQIEDLMRKRNELTDEIGNLIQMKDKGFQEYESLSSKNTQLAQHNNELIRSIQGMYQEYRAPNGTPTGANGLGISGAAVKADATSSEVRNLNPVITDPSMPNLLQDPEAESATVLNAPQVVNIRKGGQAKKFNWRRGGEKVAGKVTKGIKGAFVGVEHKPQGPGQYAIGMPYSSTQAVAGGEQSSITSKGTLGDDSKGYGFFNQKNGGIKGGLGHFKNNSSSNVVMDASVLFGSELSARCDYERQMVPGMVVRCIAEVEMRGMDVEGIYRKSGGAGQVKNVQQGFEKNNNFDISDDDLDIHAVTSALKQYFRKLPTPLITYDVYEALLEAGQLSDREKQAQALKAAVESLPDAHRDTLSYLMVHLAKVMGHESKNLMTPLNLAVVFAPTIMRPLSIEREMSDMQVQRTAVQAMLEHHKTVFSDED